MRDDWSDRLAGFWIPDPCRAIQTPGQDGTAIRAEYGLVQAGMMFEDGPEYRRLSGP